MGMWVSISTQGSMKYEIYSSIEHDNVIEQQMPGIHVGIYYIFSVVCVSLHNTIIYNF